jgi:hypothetical protein
MLQLTLFKGPNTSLTSMFIYFMLRYLTYATSILDPQNHGNWFKAFNHTFMFGLPVSQYH